MSTPWSLRRIQTAVQCYHRHHCPGCLLPESGPYRSSVSWLRMTLGSLEEYGPLMG